MKKEHNMVLPLPLGSDGGLREYVLTASGFSRKEIWQEKKKKKTPQFSMRCSALAGKSLKHPLFVRQLPVSSPYAAILT